MVDMRGTALFPHFPLNIAFHSGYGGDFQGKEGVDRER